MVKNATIVIVGGTVGYLIGGVLGDINLFYVFIAQFVGLMLMVLYTFLFVSEGFRPKLASKLKFKDVNPFSSFKSKDIILISF